MARSAASHLFVIHGDLARIHADGYVIPTSGQLQPGKTWRGVLSDGEPRWESPLIPGRRARIRPGIVRAGSGDQPGTVLTERLIVAADIAAPQDNMAHLLSGLRIALDEVSDRWLRLRPPTLRERPLLAMPLIGSGRGGFRGVQGKLVLELLRELDERLPALGFDVVLVCWNRAQYAAVQHTRRQERLCLPQLPEPLESEATRLAAEAERGSLGVLFGAGVSVPLGLPSWGQLLTRLAEGTPAARLGDLSTLDPVDAASLIMDALASDAEEDAFSRRLAACVTVKRHSLPHGLMASTRPTVAVTTNYDRGFELALSHVAGVRQPWVLPWDPPMGAGVPRLVKLHGDVHQGSVVLSSEDFVLLHAVRRPLTALLQEQMLAHHVLAVGTSMSDATLVSAISEAHSLLRMIGKKRSLGTLVMTQRDPARAALLRRSMDVLFADGPPWRAPDDARAPRDQVPPQGAARTTDLLLDRIAMLATKELNHLADPQFGDLIRGDQHLGEIAQAARGLRTAIDSAPAEHREQLTRIMSALDDLGATSQAATATGEEEISQRHRRFSRHPGGGRPN